jgi:hypothetical protein
MHAGFWWKTPKERDIMGEPGEDAKVILEWVLKK